MSPMTMRERGWVQVKGGRTFCSLHWEKNIPIVTVENVVNVYDFNINKTKESKSADLTGMKGDVRCPYCLGTHMHGSTFDPEWGDRDAHCAMGILKYRLTGAEFQSTLDL